MIGVVHILHWWFINPKNTNEDSNDEALPGMPWRDFLLSPIGIGNARADSILLLSTGVAAEDNAVVSLLTADGHNVTVGPDYFNYSGTPSLSGYSAVILLQNNNGDGENIPTGGQRAC